MSTENLNTSPPPMSGDELTPAERAYFESGGTQTEGLAPEAPKPAPVPKETAADDTDAGIDDVEEIETEDPDQPRDDKGRFVPKSAYLRVKGEKDATSQKLAAVAAELIRQRERHATMAELLTAAQPQRTDVEPERDISPEEDIFGAYKQLSKKFQELAQRVDKTDQNAMAQIQAMQLQTAARTDLESFASREPAFMEAYGYLVSQRDQELQALGVVDPAQRQATIKAEARDLMEGALKGGQSAAERIWRLAQARGFKAARKDEPAPLDPQATEQIERINKGKEANKSLRGAGTTSDTGQPLTLAKLADMPEAEFSRTRQAYIAKHGKGAWDRFIGGG